MPRRIAVCRIEGSEIDLREELRKIHKELRSLYPSPYYYDDSVSEGKMAYVSRVGAMRNIYSLDGSPEENLGHQVVDWAGGGIISES